MLSLFRTNQFISNILLLFYVLVLRSTVFFVPDTELIMSHPGVLSKVVYGLVGMQGPLADSLSLVLVLIQALLINVIAAKYRMARSVTLYPGLFYIIIVSCFPDFLHLSPIIMANTFVLLALYELYDSYKRYSSAGEFYNVGLFLGLAGLFYYSMLVFLLAAIIGFVILRSFRVKELLMLLSGLISPFWLVGVWFFFIGKSSLFWNEALFDNMGSFHLTNITDVTIYVQLAVFASLLLLVLISYSRYAHKISIRAHKNIDILYWFLAISGFSILLQHGIAPDHLLIMSIPLAMLFSMTMLYMDNRLAEAFHFLIVAGILLTQTEALWNR